MKVTKERVTQWRLRQRQQVRHQLQHLEGEARGLEHQLLQIYLQMHFSSSWKDLMDLERSRPSSLRGWQPCRTSLMFFQQNLTALPHIMSSDPLAIPVKKGKEVFEKQLLRGSTNLRGSSQKQCLYYVLDNCCYYGFDTLLL